MTWPDVACELGGSRCRARSPRPDGDQGVTAKPQTAARRAEGAAPRPVPGGLGTPRPQGQGSARGRGIWALGAGARVLGQDGGLLLTGTQPPGGTCGPPTGHIDLLWPASGCGVRSIIGRHRRAHRAGCTGSPGWAWRWLLGRRRPWLHLLRPKPLPRGLDAGSRGWGTAASAFAHSRTSVATGPGSDPHLHTRPSPQAGDRLRQGSSWHTLPPRRPAPHGPKPHREQHAGPGGRECEAGEHTEGPTLRPDPGLWEGRGPVHPGDRAEAGEHGGPGGRAAGCSAGSRLAGTCSECSDGSSGAGAGQGRTVPVGDGSGHGRVGEKVTGAAGRGAEKDGGLWVTPPSHPCRGRETRPWPSPSWGPQARGPAPRPPPGRHLHTET